jgi:uncharacterized protein YjbJ (UPF0337 family)
MGEAMDKMKGRAKQAAGDVSDNERLQAEGKFDEAKGKMRQKFNEGKNGD